MSIVLLDVNLLIALAWPTHVHHRVAREWFRKHHHAGWATCSLTEGGFIRVSSNSAILEHAVSPAEALRLLQQLRKVPQHVYWGEVPSLAACPEIADLIMGHRQVSDAQLLALAAARGGRLATLDRRVGNLLPKRLAAKGLLEVLQTTEPA